MNKKIIVTVGLGLLLVGTLVGCKNNNKTTYETIMDKKEMTYTMSAVYPPFNFINDDGDVAGFDIDIANAIAEKMGVKAVPITTEWEGIVASLIANRSDMIIGSMAITPERKKKVNFTAPYYHGGAQFFAKKGTTLKSIKDLKNGKVGVVTGTTFIQALDKMDNISKVLQFQSDIDNFKSVVQGRSDGLVTDYFVGLEAPKKYGVDIEAVGKLLYVEDNAIAIRKEDTKLLEVVNKALKDIIADGTYEKISMKWFGINIQNINK
ncbi:transporter substrate-binding domain-containing protein [Clostridium bowmanii]|uniref:transporter substrate-binding domain-containing protein n=1 Tax=Clostridium bowmanii TaxID=132925 RepID=UPI001C0BB700|nr:transporter substrate-binding domain-containing protein [Clostridium bowmanii]MBU3188311.1 transporter substrate-binding domain-containing protein [Clostridium bowmanii]MCA1072699.1 transporter substrate-binding domain-containing protein [Clostridium bowmanii]